MIPAPPESLRCGVSALSSAIRTREVSAVEITSQLLDYVGAADTGLHAFVTVDADGALAAAARADEELAEGRVRGVLHGVPIAIKDNIATAGLRTTFNSRAYGEWIPEREGQAVARLRAAGAVVIGKTNLNEFGWSTPAPSDLVPPALNPWDTSHEAIGSSTGSGVAVSACMAFAALGTDGGGSVRLPASQMGLVGLKPSRGSVPGQGNAMDEVSVIGVLARNVADTIAMYSVMSEQTPSVYPVNGQKRRLAIPRRQIEAVQLDPDVAAAFAEDLKRLKQLGIELVDVDLPHLDTAKNANFVLIAALSHASRYDDLRDKLDLVGEGAKRFLLAGAVAGVGDYLNAHKVSRLVLREIEAAIAGCDGLVTPVSPVATAEAARRPGATESGLDAAFTSPFNLLGWPAISVPSHVGRIGIPIGLQIVTRPGDEWALFGLAEAFESAVGWPGLYPACGG